MELKFYTLRAWLKSKYTQAGRKRIILTLWLLILLIPKPAKSFDLITAAAGSLTTTVISKIAQWLLSPSKSEADYSKRDQYLKFQTKEDFLKEFETLKKIAGYSPLLILGQHELYRYPNFLAAAKEAFPVEYTDYIKKLYEQTTQFYEHRNVRGFKVEKKGYFLLKNMRGIRSYDYYEFYELVKQLLAEIIEKEIYFPQEALEKDIPTNSTSTTMHSNSKEVSS